MTYAFNRDCMSAMAEFADKFFDLAIVDPPYGIDGNSHRENHSRGKLAKAKRYHTALWDQPVPEQAYYNELSRVSKNQIVWGGNHFGMPPSSCWIVWDKVNEGNDFADCELGMKILDTHLGSGSSRIAAHDMGFDFWGYELDKDYFEAHEKRFKQHISQLTLSL